MFFGKWDAEIHKSPNQVKRVALGEKLSKSIIKMDVERQTCTMMGSSGSLYNVSLNDCSCTDFAMRLLPCKHIYCLANKLGLLGSLPKLNETAAASFSADNEISRYYEYYLSGAISAEKFAKIADALQKGK